MGSNQFQREYIEYLQERNAELMGRLNHMKENYEHKILSKDLKKHYLTSTLEDVLNICTQIPQEIDLFFDKMTAAMGILKNILLRKSEMVQLVEKISKVINSGENYGTDLIAVDNSGLLKDSMSETRRAKKTGTVRVSPMINGHVISTEPRIYLSRVPEVFTPRTRFETQTLSPIIEASPDISSDLSNKGRSSLRDITKPVERLNLNKMSFSYLNEESPKSRFKGPKTWKKSLSSAKHQSENPRNSAFLENKENFNKKVGIGEIENVDPMEGPSWLYNENDGNPSLNSFMDYRRRKHRFATVFDKSEEYISSNEEKVLKLSQGNEDESTNNEDDGEDVVENEDEEGDGDGGNNGDDVGDESGEDGNTHEDLSQSHNNSKDKTEDLKEFRSIINETSEDLFCESYISENEENISPSLKKRSSLIKRKRTKDDSGHSVDKSNTGSNENFTLEISTSETLIKKKKSMLVSAQLDASNNRNVEGREIRRSKKSKKSYMKRHSRPVLENTNTDTSIKKGSYKYEYDNKKARISVNPSDLGAEQTNLLIKDALEKEAFVKLEDCMINKEIVTERVKKSPSETRSIRGSALKSISKSPANSVVNEGRQRRKAAPTFKLVEPKLSTKLRRN